MKAVLHGTLGNETDTFQSSMILPNPPPKRHYRPMVENVETLPMDLETDLDHLNFRTDHYALAGVQDGVAHYHYVKSTCV